MAENSGKRLDQVIDKRPARTPRAYIPAAVRRDVLATGECAYCEDDATHVDHIVPLAQGGTDDRENLAPSCRWCNEEKLDFTPEQWRAWREECGQPWPPVPRHVQRWEAAMRVLSRISPQEMAELEAEFLAKEAVQR